MLFTIGMYATLDSTGIKEIGNQQRRLKPGTHGIEVKSSACKVDDTFRGPMSVEQMKQVGVCRLIAHRIVAIEGGQSLTRSSAWQMLIAFVVEQITDV